MYDYIMKISISITCMQTNNGIKYIYIYNQDWNKMRKAKKIKYKELLGKCRLYALLSLLAIRFSFSLFSNG